MQPYIPSYILAHILKQKRSPLTGDRRWKKKLDQLISSWFAATQFMGMLEQVRTQHLSLTSCTPPYPQVQCCEQCWWLQRWSQHWTWGTGGALDFWTVLVICRCLSSHFLFLNFTISDIPAFELSWFWDFGICGFRKCWMTQRIKLHRLLVLVQSATTLNDSNDVRL